MSLNVEMSDLKPCPFCGNKVNIIINDMNDMRIFRDDRDINAKKYYLRENVRIECKKCQIRTGEWTAQVEVDPATLKTNYSLSDTEAVKRISKIWNNRVADLPKEGQWEKSDIPGEKYVCSICGGACWYYDCQGEVAKSRFCPSCGAKMKDFK